MVLLCSECRLWVISGDFILSRSLSLMILGELVNLSPDIVLARVSIYIIYITMVSLFFSPMNFVIEKATEESMAHSDALGHNRL